MERILDAEGVPDLLEAERARVRQEIVTGRGAMTPDGARRLLDVTLRHPQVSFFVSALGAPPPDAVARLKECAILVGARCGKAAHAVRQRAAGVDAIIAQDTEAGGHTGDLATMVVAPQVIRSKLSEAWEQPGAPPYLPTPLQGILYNEMHAHWCARSAATSIPSRSASPSPPSPRRLQCAR